MYVLNRLFIKKAFKKQQLFIWVYLSDKRIVLSSRNNLLFDIKTFLATFQEKGKREEEGKKEKWREKEKMGRTKNKRKVKQRY